MFCAFEEIYGESWNAGFCQTNEALGGHWEGIAGGVLIVHVPRKLNLDIQQELKRIEYRLKPGDIVLIHTGAGAYQDEDRYLTRKWNEFLTS